MSVIFPLQWNLENVYFLSQTIASFGVLASIFYLAIQLKHSTKECRQRAIYSTSQELRNILGMLATDDSLGEVFNKASVSINLNDLERLQWYTFIGNCMRIFENSYNLIQKKDIDKAYWKGVESMLIDITNMKAFLLFWDDRKHWYGDKFQAYMDAYVILKKSSEKINVPGHYI